MYNFTLELLQLLLHTDYMSYLAQAEHQDLKVHQKQLDEILKVDLTSNQQEELELVLQ